MSTIRPLHRDDIVVRELNGYYIRLMVEYPPLGLRQCVKLRRWNEAEGTNSEDAITQVLAFFDHEIQRMAEHIEGLKE